MACENELLFLNTPIVMRSQPARRKKWDMHLTLGLDPYRKTQT